MKSQVYFASMPCKITRSITPQEDELLPGLTLYYRHTGRRSDGFMILSVCLSRQRAKEGKEEKGKKFK